VIEFWLTVAFHGIVYWRPHQDSNLSIALQQSSGANSLGNPAICALGARESEKRAIAHDERKHNKKLGTVSVIFWKNGLKPYLPLPFVRSMLNRLELN
jgi:hypothetical protein